MSTASCRQNRRDPDPILGQQSQPEDVCIVFSRLCSFSERGGDSHGEVKYFRKFDA